MEKICLVWFWKEGGLGRCKRICGSFHYIIVRNFCYEITLLWERVCVTLKRGGEYGVKLYFDSCNGKWLIDSQISYWCWIASKDDKALGKVVHIIMI
jgi:hypothetical protein